MKKILSILLAIAMLFSLGVSALADSDTGDNNTISSTTEGNNSKTKNVTASYTPTSGGTTTTAEALWGTSAESLPNSGTLEAAIEAANAGSAAYIQLQKNVTATSIYDISGNITVTIDLNGHTVTSSADEAIALSGTGATTVTLKDSAGNGKVICSGDNAIAVSAGTLTIEGGSFTATTDAVITNGTTTIKGGTFAARITYADGTLDLSGYTTAAITDLTVYNGSSTVTVGTEVKLPSGYAFYKSDDTTQATVTELKESTTYAIKSTSGGTTTTAEAKWGTDKDHLTESGTLAEAIAAAEAEGSTVTYIQLQKDVTATSAYKILGGAFTLDLNGKTISSNAYVFEIGDSATNSTSGIDVTFTASGTTGKVESTGASYPAIEVICGTVTFNGGSYGALVMSNSGTEVPYASVTVKGGSFTSDTSEAITNNGGTLTIEGGSFTGDSYAVVALDGTTTIKDGSFTLNSSETPGVATIQYWVGKLDLSGYTGTVTDLTVYAGTAVTVSADTIKLPSGCSFYAKGDTNKTTVTSLAAETVYAIQSTSGGTTTTAEAMWGADEGSLNNSGTLEAAIAAAKAGNAAYIQLQTDVTAASIYDISGNITVTIDLNGHTVTSTADEAIALSGTGATTVTLKDSAGNGKVICSGENAIAVSGGTLTIEGGSYESLWSPLVVDGSATIEGGTFSATDEGAYVIMNNGTLTIKGGTFSGCTTGNESGAVCNNSGGTLTIEGGSFAGTTDAVITYGTTTIKGGTFAPRITYAGGTLDLSGYTTAAITDLTVYNDSSTVTVGTKVKLPSGYAFYKSDDTTQATVTELKANNTYAIKSTSGGTTTDTATITGVSVKVGDTTYTTGTVTLTADSGDVTITVTGTNLNNLTTNNRIVTTAGAYWDMESTSWDVNDAGTEASMVMALSLFTGNTTAVEVKYSNDGSNWTGTGIYIQYQAETTSVDITWGSMSFTYSDEQVSGADKGWTYASGANAVEVENKGTAAVKAGVAFAKSSSVANVTNVTGSFDKTSATLAASASETFTLTLSGKPDGALAEGTVIGNVTVTITGASS